MCPDQIRKNTRCDTKIIGALYVVITISILCVYEVTDYAFEAC